MMVSRRLLKLVLAGVFLSCATLYWNLQRDLIKEHSPLMIAYNNVPAALVMNLQQSTKSNDVKSQTSETSGHIPLVALVSCQDRTPLTLVTLKSALMLSHRQLRFVIFADRENAKELNTQISRFPRRIRSQASFSILPVEFPASAREAQAVGLPHESGKFRSQSHLVGDGGSEWRQLFKPCSAQRLFLPELLKEEDAVLYVDTDTIFLRPIEQLWELFGRMNHSHMIAAVSESEDDKSGWYPRLARHPFVQPRGINSGVMLLNLTRLRNFDWSQRVAAVYEQWRERVVWGDQDIINIVFSNYSDAVYMLPCEWNFRPDHCQYASLCKGANKLGPGLLHGSRAVLTNNKQPAFRAVFRAFQDFTFRKRSTRLKFTLNSENKTNLAPKLVINGRKYNASHKKRTFNLKGKFATKQATQLYPLVRPNNLAIYDNNNKGERKVNRDGSRIADYDYTAEEKTGKYQERQREMKANAKHIPMTEEDDEDDEVSLKERLISPLTIGIFETVNTRCGRFLKAHTKRLTRALYARAKDL